MGLETQDYYLDFIPDAAIGARDITFMVCLSYETRLKLIELLREHWMYTFGVGNSTDQIYKLMDCLDSTIS